MTLTARAVYKELGKTPILRGLDVEIHAGQIAVLLGPSGGGKTTALRTLSLLEPPDQGDILIDGVGVNSPEGARPRPQELWPKVTVVFQELYLWPHLTLRQNITLPREMSGKNPMSDRIRECLEELEIRDLLNRYPRQVSHGQRQRAALVRAIGVEPEYLLLDEVTSALDVEQISKVEAILDRLRRTGMAILAVSHLIGFARRLADQVLFLDQGRITERGGPDIVTSPTSPRLRAFLSVQT